MRGGQSEMKGRGMMERGTVRVVPDMDGRRGRTISL
jgi:hypothetical protein